MSNIKISAVVGSLRKDSINMQLFNSLKELVPTGVSLELADISQLPLFNQDDESDLPESVKKFKAEIESADGILFVTPEHNRSYTAAIKNAIDWGSRPWNSNSWDKKPAAVTGATGGGLGTFGAQHHLRQAGVGINVYMLPEQLYFGGANDKFDNSGQLADEDTVKLLKDFMATFVNWINFFKN